MNQKELSKIATDLKGSDNPNPPSSYVLIVGDERIPIFSAKGLVKALADKGCEMSLANAQTVLRKSGSREIILNINS